MKFRARFTNSLRQHKKIWKYSQQPYKYNLIFLGIKCCLKSGKQNMKTIQDMIKYNYTVGVEEEKLIMSL